MKSSRPLRHVITILGLLVFTATQAQDTTADCDSHYKLQRPIITAENPHVGRYLDVLGSSMHYIESGSGDPVLFIHGNPTSSYLWRNIMPFVSEHHHAIALDLIGMGASDKPDIDYRFIDHYRYVEGFIEALDLHDITLIIHDWGAALGMEYARRHPDRVKAVAFMEGVLPPVFPQPSFEAMGEEMGNMFRALRDPLQGEELVIENNIFVEQILPGFINRPLDEAAMNAYRAPYLEKSARRPLLVWPRELPIAGEPADVLHILEAQRSFLQTTELPMLLLYASPGALVPPALVPWYAQNIEHLETVFIGQGFHFIQEDQPEAIGRALADWMRRLDDETTDDD